MYNHGNNEVKFAGLSKFLGVILTLDALLLVGSWRTVPSIVLERIDIVWSREAAIKRLWLFLFAQYHTGVSSSSAS